MKAEYNDGLFNEICKVLRRLEDENKLTLCSVDPHESAKEIYDAISDFPPAISSIDITEGELSSVRQLIFQATFDKKFFDWEMPTLTGLTAEEFQKVAKKLPNI